MIDRGRIEQQLNAIGEGARWWDVRELRDLPAVLRDDEQILAIARGRLSRVRRRWLVVLTDKRVLFLRSFAGAGWRHIEIDVQLVERVALRTGPLNGSVLIVAPGVKQRVLLPRPDAFRLHAHLASFVATRAHLPGYGGGHLVRRMFDHVLALPAVAFGAPPTPLHTSYAAAPQIMTQRDHELEQRVQTLEEQVVQLQQQVEFLEELLRERQLGSDVPPACASRSLSGRRYVLIHAEHVVGIVRPLDLPQPVPVRTVRLPRTVRSLLAHERDVRARCALPQRCGQRPCPGVMRGALARVLVDRRHVDHQAAAAMCIRGTVRRHVVHCATQHAHLRHAHRRRRAFSPSMMAAAASASRSSRKKLRMAMPAKCGASACASYMAG
jgi:hypothetical protein